MNDAVKLLEDDGQDVNLTEIQTLVNDLITKQKKVAELEASLKAANEEVRKLETVTLPEKMGSLTQLKIDVGPIVATLNVRRILRANIKAENKGAAYAWLDDHGLGDIIKSEISVKFGRSELDRAKEVEAELRQKGLEPSLDQTIHWSTLDSTIKEQLDKGMDFPDIISIYEGKKVELKYGK